MIHDVVIVGAGAAGVGCGVVLRELGIDNFLLVDRDGVGASFDRWPAGMRFITPSFTSNAFGLLDLNAVALNTSPAYTLKTEHPSGREYANYLRAVAHHARLPVKRGVDVEDVLIGKDAFHLQTSRGKIRAHFVIWAAGEFQYPNAAPFPGAGHCVHGSTVERWSELPGSEAVVIGGYESGADAAVQLAAAGKTVTVLDRGAPWKTRESDPSVALSPFTRDRLEAANGAVKLVGKTKVLRVTVSESRYRVHASGGTVFESASPPILATGFTGSLERIKGMFEWTARGHAVLTARDESTVAGGLFLAGPQIRHAGVIFCFIYKFRQRFAVVGGAIAERLGVSTKPLERYRESQMFLDDLSCCQAQCEC